MNRRDILDEDRDEKNESHGNVPESYCVIPHYYIFPSERLLMQMKFDSFIQE